MKAIVYTRYGSPDVLELKEIEKPTPKNNEILVRIHATTVTAADCHFRAGDPFIARFFSAEGFSIRGFRRPLNPTPGYELAGEIEAVGKDVRRFKVGDQVFGEAVSGSSVEYTCLPEDGVLAIMPSSMGYHEAVAVSGGMTTALPYLRDAANIQKGQQVLIYGASGSIGTCAVQLAKYFGAEVTGICSTSNLDLVRSLGADHVIDYTKEDFTKNGETYDIIFDTVQKSSFGRCKRSLKQQGVYLKTFPSLTNLTSKLGRRRSVFAPVGLRTGSEKSNDLILLRELVESGKVKPVIDRTYPLEEIIEAHRYVDEGHKKGNVVITVGHTGPSQRTFPADGEGDS